MALNLTTTLLIIVLYYAIAGIPIDTLLPFKENQKLLATSIFQFITAYTMMIVLKTLSNEIETEFGFLSLQYNILVTAAIVILIGNTFSVIPKFGDSNGTAMTLGVITVLDIVSALVLLLLGLLILASTRYAIPSLVLPTITLPFLLPEQLEQSIYSFLGIVIIMIAVINYREGIGKLYNGVEQKVLS